MPPAPRPPNYPLDVTGAYTTAERKQIGASVGPIGNAASGLLHDAEGDVRKFVVYGAVRRASRDVYTGLAYLDLIDLNVVVLQDRIDQLALQQQQLVASVAALQASCATIAASLEQVMKLLGTVIPAWIDKEEVESGDDMGMVRPSAAELGLTVVFETVRQAAGFGHHDVVSISPSAGTLVAQGQHGHGRDQPGRVTPRSVRGPASPERRRDLDHPASARYGRGARRPAEATDEPLTEVAPWTASPS